MPLRLTGWCQDKWISGTGGLTRKRHDITEKLLKAALNTKQSINCSSPSPLETHLQRTTFENIVAKLEIAMKLLRNCSSWAISPYTTIFSTVINIYKLIYKLILFMLLPRCLQRRLLQFCCMRERVNTGSRLHFWLM